MANPYPIEIADAGDGSVKVAGKATFTDPSNQPGGGSQPVTHQELAGTSVVIPNLDSARLVWDQDTGPDSLLDLTVPTIPTIITAGVYVIQVGCEPSSTMTADGWYEMQLQLDKDGFNASAYASSPRAVVTSGAGFSGFQPDTSITMAWYMPAGARVEVWITNVDGASAIGFYLQTAHIQRLS